MRVALVGQPIAVIVEIIAELRCQWMNRRVSFITVGRGDPVIKVEICCGVTDDVARRAVLINPIVAALRRSWVDRVRPVIAVFGWTEAISVLITWRARLDLAIAVQVALETACETAGLCCPRIGRRVSGITIHRVRHAITVPIVGATGLIDDPIAVIVDVVRADLRGREAVGRAGRGPVEGTDHLPSLALADTTQRPEGQRVAVLDVERLLIDEAITVIIDAITDLFDWRLRRAHRPPVELTK